MVISVQSELATTEKRTTIHTITQRSIQLPPPLGSSPFHRSSAAFYFPPLRCYILFPPIPVLHSISTDPSATLYFPPLRCYILFPTDPSATLYFHRSSATFYFPPIQCYTLFPPIQCYILFPTDPVLHSISHRSSATFYTPATSPLTLAAPTAPCPQTFFRIRAGLGADLAPTMSLI